MKKKRKRDSRFELLRIMSMFMITIYHFSFFGQRFRENDNLDLLMLIGSKLFIIYGQIGVCIFVLITGYFLVERKISINYALKQVWKIWTETFFYTVLLYFITSILNGKLLGLKALIKSFFPFSFNVYWFITAYIMLILLIPYINKILFTLHRNEMILLILILILINDFLPLLNNNVATQRSGLGMLITPYVVGGYIRRFGIRIRFKPLYLLLSLIVMYVVSISLFVFWNSNRGEMIFFDLVPLISATLVFLMFVEIRPFYNKKINLIATTVFSSYIVTEYPWLMFKMWDLLSFKNIKNTFLVDILGALIIFIFIFMFMFIVDMFRQWIFTKFSINNNQRIENVFCKVEKFSNR